jgi:hypothetical protein
MLNNIAALLTSGAPPEVGDYESIATVSVGAGGSSAITFSSIASTYKHLQIRVLSRGTNASTYVETRMQFNGDTGSNYYANHQLLGNGSAASASADATATFVSAHYSIADTNTASVYSGAVIDLLDYSNTNKFKTVRNISGTDTNGLGFIIYRSGLWRSTSAISSISITPSAGNWKQYSSFALYGIK